MKYSRRLADVAAYPFARWASHLDAARQRGLDVIRLDIGNPDLAPPNEVIEALCGAAHLPGQHGYPGYRGIPALREAIVNYYRRRFDVILDPEDEVVPLIGSKEGIVMLALACLDSGDLVLVPDPGYAAYSVGATLAGADQWAFPLPRERGFVPDLSAIPTQLYEKTAMMWLNFPNNPTGATVDVEFFQQAVSLAQDYGFLLCHDAPYCDVTFDGYQAPSLLQVPGATEVAIEFNSLSKTCNMAGWRVGAAVGHAPSLAALAQLKSNFDSGIFRPVQEAAALALSLDSAWISERNQIYAERMDILVDGLNAAGLVATRPRGTLYAWARVPDAAELAVSSGRTSEAFALALLQETGVVVAPGTFFGASGEGYIRVSVTAPTEKLRDGMERLRRFGDRHLSQ